MSNPYEWFYHKPKISPVVLKLKNLKKILSEKEHQVHLICPICGNEDGRTTYEKPSELNNWYGTFQCPKCHSSFEKFLAELGMKRYQARYAFQICISEVPIHELVEAAEDVISSTRRVFCCGKTLYSVDMKSGRMAPLEAADVTTILSRQCQWIKYDARSKCNVPTDPPKKVVSTILESSFHPAVPEVLAICCMPFVRQDGSLCMTPGYDSKTKIIACFDPKEFQPYEWSTKLTKSDAEQALNDLKRLLAEFPCYEPVDESASLEGILKAVNRAVLVAAPMTLVQANAPGCGKSTLCGLYAKLVTKNPVAEKNLPTTDEEMAKTLIATLSSSSGVITFDNIVGNIPAFASLCTCLSSSFFEQRKLGGSTILQVSSRVLFLANGNFVHPEGDLLRRVLPLQLVARNAHPEQRSFSNANLLDFVAENRARLIMNALRITAAYLQSGEKISCPPLSGYEEWSLRCRKPLIWLGLPDPAKRIFEQLNEDDPLTANRYALLKSLRVCYGDQIFTVKTIVTDKFDSVLNCLCDLGFIQRGVVNKGSLGWALKDLSTFPVKDLRLEAVKKSHYRVFEVRGWE